MLFGLAPALFGYRRSLNSIKTNFKTIPPTLFPPMWNFQNDKKKIEDSEISKYKNRKLSKFTWRKAHTENFTQIIWRPPKWQKGNWKLLNFKISKQKTFQVSERKTNISTLVKLHTKKLKTPKMTRRKLKIAKFQNKKTKNFQNSHAPFPHLWNFTQKN